MGSTPSEAKTCSFPQEMHFQGHWRTYQTRLLDRFGDCVQPRLHLVAAPGSGKTVLGIELVRRINQPTLVLAPTIAIRNQWKERLLDKFLPPGFPEPEWISTDLRNPVLFTVATYQSLHALCSGKPHEAAEYEAISQEQNSATEELELEEDQNPDLQDFVPELLRGFKTLVLDEAHHLRTEWWRSLKSVAASLRPKIISLTATPPYDVTPYEWEHYEELCGHVDAEVSVPELVMEGDLCPHQDYVRFGAPAQRELQQISEFRSAVQAFRERLKRDEALKSAVLHHPWLADTENHIPQILDNPEYLSSMLVFLRSAGVDVPKSALRLLGLDPRDKLPQEDLEWYEVLLTNFLYRDEQVSDEDLKKKLRHELQGLGAIERRKVVLTGPADHMKLLTTSKTKLKSIQEVVSLESRAMGEALRCVVLTDFIRKEEFPRDGNHEIEFEDIGVVPIFETLRRADIPAIRLGVLCGSLVIIPAESEAMLRDCAKEMNAALQGLRLDRLHHAPNYVVVELTGPFHDGLVRLLTSLFNKGGVNVLVGTKSLLGEGWDAPWINTLVLASFVGSYVLSNQMRGRSIRVDPKQPGKTANVWHLVCVEPGDFGPGPDYELLGRRCSTFVGVSTTEAKIENGTARLALGQPPYSLNQLSELNDITWMRALDREGLRKTWQDALAAGQVNQMTEGLRAKDSTPRGFVFANTIAALSVQAFWVFETVFSQLMRVVLRSGMGQHFFSYLGFVSFLAGIASLPWSVMAVWRLICHGTPEASLRQIGMVILESLKYEGSLDSKLADFRVNVETNRDGSVYCWLEGGTGYDQAIFLRCLHEVLSPIDNPRYLLAKSRLWRFFHEDYFAVPEVLGRKKEFAEVFSANWGRHVGKVELFYTRTLEGRKMLLRARIHSFVASFQSRSERVSCWK